MSTRIVIAGVSERDVDLLLLEEFQSSTSFQEWFVSQALGPSVSLGHCVAAQRSVTQSTGESDLEIVFIDAQGTQTRMLIENKVNAGLQPFQAERYHLRGEAYVSRGECSAYYTVIVAPARYFGESGTTKGFDWRVTYEQILQWFIQAEFLGERRQYKTALLKSAIDKGTLGYQPEEDAPTTEFWRAYWLLSREHAPELEMKEPTIKPSGSTFIYFRPPALPRGIEICHKLTRGCVDLQLSGMGHRLNEVHTVLAHRFTADMQLSQAAKSAAIRLTVPVLDTNGLVETQIQEIRAGLDAARHLLQWFLEHQNAWSIYKDSSQPH